MESSSACLPPGLGTAYARAALKGGDMASGRLCDRTAQDRRFHRFLASSASVLYYSTTVTYADNTTEEVGSRRSRVRFLQMGKIVVIAAGRKGSAP